MPEYESSLPINASADAVFDYVSDLRNLPQFQPAMRSARLEDGGKVHVHGEAQGRPFDANGWVRVDRDEYRMEWGSDALDLRYRGWLEIEGAGDQSLVTIHLSFAPKEAGPEVPPGAAPTERPDTALEKRLGDALAAIRENFQDA